MTRTAALDSAALGGGVADDTQDIDDLIYLMSHDVRASVRALLELPQWIAEDLEEAGVPISGSVAQSIDMMNKHTARLDRMLIDLLAYSRVGRMQDVIRVDLNAMLEEVLGQIRLPDGMRIVRDIAPVPVRMGEQDALLMISALIGNAVKHHDTPNKGEILFQTSRTAGWVILTVSDNGPGIAAQDYEKAISAMTTLRPRDEVEGTGMGLANVRKIAAHYGGQISLAPAAPSRGLSVRVTLPASDAAD